MRTKDDERFGDLVYRAWRSGKNPDYVERERYDEHRAAGCEPEEITVPMVIRPQPKNVGTK